jgi:GMP synthase-like glutamine amidotransferase
VRVLAVVHQADAGPGVFAEAIAEYGAALDQWLLPGQPAPPADPHSYDAVFILGGSMNADQGERHPWLRQESALLAELLERRTPLMGLCLGGQMVAQAAGGVARRAARPEIGWFEIAVGAAGSEDPVMAALAPRFEAFCWHSYEFTLPPGAVELARTDLCIHACRIGDAAWALQFHPEVSATDALAWTDGYEVDEDAVAIGLDAEGLHLETEAKIAAFNQLGRDICRRWLEFAASR